MIFPNLLRAGIAAIRLAWYKSRGYEILADESTTKLRNAQCAQCDFRVGEQCSICTCFIPAKVALNPEQCPKRYWLRINRKKHLTRKPSI